MNSSCQPLNEITHKSWFVLPPLMEYYYQNKNPLYKTLPPFRNDCMAEGQKSMDFIYPAEALKVFLPKDFDNAVFKEVGISGILNAEVSTNCSDNFT